jgi:hypothetical protein
MSSGDKIKHKLNSMGRHECYLICDREIENIALRWYCHVERMKKGKLPKDVLLWSP